MTILNFHNARPYLQDKDSHFLQPQNTQKLAEFRSIISVHNIKAIFVGHEHLQFYCHAQNDKVFGSIPIYTVGALFRGDYRLVNVQGKNINVQTYNGQTGDPVLGEDFFRSK